MKNVDQRGSTLLLVTWLLAILGMVATFLIYRAEAEWAVVINAEEQTRVRQIAEQALYDRLADLLKDETKHDTPNEPWFNDTGRFEYEQDGYKITVIVEDEGSKPNINVITGSGLNVFIPDDMKLSIDPVLDWMDVDNDIREDGAEASYYQALNPPYKPRNGFFSSLRELLAVKDGATFYKYFAPELTVYGKLNLNTLDKEKFKFLLLLGGEHPTQVTSIADTFEEYKVLKSGRFETLKDLDKVKGMLVGTADKLKPFFNLAGEDEKFSGNCNLNLVSRLGLKAHLASAGFRVKNSMITNILLRRQEEAIESVDVIAPLLGLKQPEEIKRLNDYFTTTSSIFRYRIWAVKGNQKYHIDTVQERIPGDLRVKWKLRTLSWQVQLNQNVPEIPSLTPFEATLDISEEEKEEEAEEEAEESSGNTPENDAGDTATDSPPGNLTPGRRSATGADDPDKEVD